MTVAAVRDGTSNTYLVGEKFLDPDYYTNSLGGGDNQYAYQGFDYDSSRWSREDTLPMPERSRIDLASSSPAK